MFSLMESASNNIKHLWLQITLGEQTKAWQYSQQYHSNPVTCYNSYVNHVCLYQFLDWLQDWLEEESAPQAAVWPNEKSLPSIWEVVNGAAIEVEQTRLVLVPTEATDLEALSVPQEWVDISSWAADYYLAVQVNLDDEDECWLRVVGFATHCQLKQEGRYNASDRSYSLSVTELTADFTILLATLGLCLQAELPPLATLSAAQAKKLLLTLGDASIYSPRLRLDVPFSDWAALIANEQWRQQLYNQRLGHVQTAKQVHLGQWFDQLFDAGWQSLDTLLTTSQLGSLAFSTRNSTAAKKADINGVKLIDLGMQLGSQSVALLVAISQEADEKVSVLVQVHPTGNEKYLPPKFQLLLVESDNILQKVQSRSRDYYIQLNRFKGLPGTSFSIKLMFGNLSITEDFAI